MPSGASVTMTMRAFPPPSFFLLLLVGSSVHGGYGGLRVGHYRESWPDAEAIVRKVVAEASAEDPTVNALLLRLHFHDCFVRVCENGYYLTALYLVNHAFCALLS
jgi:hypothetical protein